MKIHIKISISIILAVVIFCLASVIFVDGIYHASAVVTTALNFDNTRVEDDLADIDLAAFPFDNSKEPGILEFIEYCYSDNVFNQTNYALYLYVYNPQALTFSISSTVHSINVAVSYDAAGKPIDYENVSLKYIGRTTGAYEKLFYKFKVADTAKLKSNATAYSKKYGERRYDIASLQLREADKTLAEDYGVGGTWLYTGFAKGYGPDAAADSTLDCSVTDLETVELKVKHTFYRPEGSVSSNERYIQDQLNSVYFSVPNRILDNYGDMYAVKAEWYEYKTKSMFVTGNKTVYDNLNKYVGVNIGTSYNETVKYGMAIGCLTDYNGNEFCKYSYNVSDYGSLGASSDYPNIKIGKLDYLVPARENDVFVPTNDFTFSGEKLQAYVLDRSIGKNDLINDKYSKSMFEDYLSSERAAIPYVGNDIHHKLVEITRDEEYQLTSATIASGFWDRFWGKYNTIEYENIKAIKAITEKPIESDSDKLFIDKNDMNDFIMAYDTAVSEDSNLHVFRFGATEYMSISGMNIENEENMFGFTVSKELDGRVYMATDTAFIDFDIIQLTFCADGVYTVIPVVSNPIDIFNDITPPIDNNAPGDGLDWWQIFIAILFTLLLVVLVFELIQWLSKRSKKTTSNKSTKSKKRRR